MSNVQQQPRRYLNCPFEECVLGTKPTYHYHCDNCKFVARKVGLDRLKTIYHFIILEQFSFECRKGRTIRNPGRGRGKGAKNSSAFCFQSKLAAGIFFPCGRCTAWMVYCLHQFFWKHLPCRKYFWELSPPSRDF